MALAPVSFEYAWPQAALRGGIFVYWEVTIGAGEQPVDLLLPYWATMRFPMAGNWTHGNARDKLSPIGDAPLFHGLTDHATWIGGSGGSVFCIVLYPMFWSLLPKLSASTYANKVVPLSELLGDEAERLGTDLQIASSFADRVSIADAWLTQRFSEYGPNYYDLQAAKLMLALNEPGIDSVKKICTGLGVTQPQLVRLAQRYYGFTPKLLIRRERFLRMLFTMERRPYAEWPQFIDEQYVDQSHMIRDFKDFTGLAPSQYFAHPRPILSVAAEAIKRFLAGESGPASTAAKLMTQDD
jgi:AraC-like DNA-binding protein